MTEPTDAELTEVYKAANGENTGKAQPLTTKRIFRAMRAAIAKWGTPPAVAGQHSKAVPLTPEQIESLLYKYGYDPDDEHMAEMLQAATTMKLAEVAGTYRECRQAALGKQPAKDIK